MCYKLPFHFLLLPYNALYVDRATSNQKCVLAAHKYSAKIASKTMYPSTAAAPPAAQSSPISQIVPDSSPNSNKYQQPNSACEATPRKKIQKLHHSQPPLEVSMPGLQHLNLLRLRDDLRKSNTDRIQHRGHRLSQRNL